MAASEVPTGVHSLMGGPSLAEVHRAAGGLVLPAESRWLLAVGIGLRTAVALNWGVVLARWVDRRHAASHGALAGVVLWMFQVVLVGRRRPMTRRLPVWVQLADHVAFGLAAGAVLRDR